MKRIKEIIKKKVEKVFNSDLKEQLDNEQAHYAMLYKKHKDLVADFNELYNDHRKMKTELNSIIEQKNKTIKQLNGKCASYSRQLKAQKERAKEYLDKSEYYKTKANKFNTECIELGQKNFDLAVNMRSVIGKIHRIYNEHVSSVRGIILN